MPRKITPRKIMENAYHEEYGNMFVNDELYGTVEEFYTDVDDGKIEIVRLTIQQERKESGEYLLDEDYWNDPY